MAKTMVERKEALRESPLQTAAKIRVEEDILLDRILDCYPMFLMGSRALGYDTPHSDVDLCVKVPTAHYDWMFDQLRRIGFFVTDIPYSDASITVRNRTYVSGTPMDIMLEPDENVFWHRLEQHERLRDELVSQTHADTVSVASTLRGIKHEIGPLSGIGKHVYRALVKMLLDEDPV